MQRPGITRPGFSLVELLVVIAIISILAALTGAAVQKARERAREAQCRADITNLETAIGQFKAKFGVYPPCSGSGGGGMFILASTYHHVPANPTTDPELILLQQMFPRISPGDNGLRQLDPLGNPTPPNAANLFDQGIPRNTPVLLDPNQCLVFFLSGGVFTGYSGFSTSPTAPFAAPAAGAASSTRLQGGPMMDFPGNRLLLRTEFREFYFVGTNPQANRFPGDNFNPRREQPWFVDPWGTPYLYFNSSAGNDYRSTPWQLAPWGGPHSPNPAGVLPFFTGSGTGMRFLNPKTFQIISAGRNRQFGPGGLFTPGQGAYGPAAPGGDDFANFQRLILSTAE